MSGLQNRCWIYLQVAIEWQDLILLQDMSDLFNSQSLLLTTAIFYIEKVFALINKQIFTEYELKGLF